MNTIQAHAAGRAVRYTQTDGSIFVKQGGTRSWRNNNPGNIRPGAFATRQGAIGEAGGFAVFPHKETGVKALLALLKSYAARGLTLQTAIARYAPPVENDTTRYITVVSAALQAPPSTPLRNLTATQFTRLSAAIRMHEGWEEGTTITYPATA